jgi:hypothetical protein
MPLAAADAGRWAASTMKTDPVSLIRTVQENISLTLAGQLTLTAFTEWYEDWYLDELEKRQNCIDKTIFEALQMLYFDIGFFEPNDEIRKEHPSYYGSDKLREKLHHALNEMANRC